MQMLRVERRALSGTPSDVLSLPFDLRKKSRLRARSEGGREVAIVLERGSSLRDGDLLAADSGEVLVVRAAAESVSEVMGADALQLARAAYHLGNRHVPLQIERGLLRYQHDHVLDEMVRGLGLEVVPCMAAFEPEGGAYSGGHSHGGERGDRLGAGVIAAHAHAHAHAHVHVHEQARVSHSHEHGRHHLRSHGEESGHGHQHAHGDGVLAAHGHEHGHEHEHEHEHEQARVSHSHEHGRHYSRSRGEESEHAHEHVHMHEHAHEQARVSHSHEHGRRSHEEESGHGHGHGHGSESLGLGRERHSWADGHEDGH